VHILWRPGLHGMMFPILITLESCAYVTGHFSGERVESLCIFCGGTDAHRVMFHILIVSLICAMWIGTLGLIPRLRVSGECRGDLGFRV